MKYTSSYYWNMYAPHRVLRRYLSRMIFNWADKKYGVEARSSYSEIQKKKAIEKWHFWMNVKNKINNPI